MEIDIHTKEDVAEHYDEFDELYENWSGSTNGGYHYGIANKIRDIFHNDIMVTNLSNKIIDSFDIDNTQKYIIFDAGCGSGDVMKIIANRYQNAQVCGMTLSQNQYNIAKKKCKKINQITIVKGDFEETNFENEKFDIIFFIDSICHATGSDKKQALKESYRLLRQGGKLIICDVFLQKDEKNWGKLFSFINQKVLNIWRVNEWGIENEIKTEMASLGYKKYKVENLTWNIAPSVLHIIFTKIPWAVGKSFQNKKYYKELLYFVRLGFYAPILGLHPIFRYQLVTVEKVKEE